MDRRGFLKSMSIAAGLVVVAPRLVLPRQTTAVLNPERRVFLPPSSGWVAGTSAEEVATYMLSAWQTQWRVEAMPRGQVLPKLGDSVLMNGPLGSELTVISSVEYVDSPNAPLHLIFTAEGVSPSPSASPVTGRLYGRNGQALSIEDLDVTRWSRDARRDRFDMTDFSVPNDL